jgi:beta-galactosidase
MLKQYRGLKRVGAPVDVITEEKDFGKYPVLVVPAAQLVDDQLVARWRAYAENGGQLIITCRTGQKDRRGFLWEGPWQAPMLDLIGAKVAFYDTLPAPNTGHVEMDGKTYAWSSWGEILEPQGPGTQVLASYTDQYYAKRPAIITRKLGRGSMTYVGVDSTSGDLEAAVIRGVYERAGISVENFDQNFVVDWRDGFWVATNFTEKQETVPAPAGTKMLVGTRELGPAGVAVWQE